MRSTPRVRTASLSFIAVTASLTLVWAAGCCRPGGWRFEEFKEARIQFAIPSDWSVRILRPGQDPVPLEEAGDPGEDGAVVTALPILEDAALVIVATQKNVSARAFARQTHKFIPLDGVVLSANEEPWAKNGLRGWVADGKGRLRSNGTPVLFRWVVLDVDGQPVLITLYAEASKDDHYKEVFDKILDSLKPIAPHTPEAQGPAPQAP